MSLAIELLENDVDHLAASRLFDNGIDLPSGLSSNNPRIQEF